MFGLRLLALFLTLAVGLSAQTVRFRTSQGDILVQLLPESAPRTVQNFLNYVNRGAYNNSFIHRSVRGFVWQGGGFRWDGNGVREIAQDPPVVNEFRVSNTRGTLAMAKLGNNPNSATNQWFFNLANNASNLDNQNGGFTVFGRVADSASLSVMDRIAALTVYNLTFLHPAMDSTPLQNVTGSTFQPRFLVTVESITVLRNPPAINDGGVTSAGAFGGIPAAAPGSWIEIYGSNLASGERSWAGADFSGVNAPASLDGVSVTVGGVPAFVSYVSPSQINVQVPANAPTSGTAPVIVTSGGLASNPMNLAMRPAVPGLLAPPGFRVGDRQFVVAQLADGRFVSNGTIPGLGTALPRPGDTLVFYGVGFGAVTPGPVAGQIAQGENRLLAPVEFRFGDLPAQVTYAGLAPNLVGLYQFNVIVPPGVSAGDVALRVTVAGEPISQTLWISLGN